MNNREEMLGLLMAWENLPIIISDLLAQPQKIGILMDIAINSSHPKSWRAAWMANKIHDIKPDLIRPYLEKMIIRLKKETCNSKKREFLRLISLHDLPKKYHSFLMDYCLNCLISSAEPVSVRVHSMQVLYHISESEPGFRPELLAVIEHETELHSTAGIRSRAKRLSSMLMKSIKSGQC
jgi:hypothetical protein